MKKIFLTGGILFIILWPQYPSDAAGDTKPVIESIINYQMVKYDLLHYQIEKKIEKIERRLDSIKNKK